jgi:CIC family chloride channel protein
MKAKRMFSSIITSAFTVGFGGSVGLEGPTVSTTSAISSNIGQQFKLNYKTKTLLIGCGAAGALAAIFKAPVAAIIFAIEVFMFDLTMVQLIPFLLTSVTATLFSRLFFGEDVLFRFPVTEVFSFTDVPYYIVLGCIAGMISVYFTKVYFIVDRFFHKLKKRPYKLIIGGGLLGVLIFLMPPLYGEGFDTMNRLISGSTEGLLNYSPLADFEGNIWVVLFFLIMVVIFKAFATSITFGAGGVGGIFAPTLFMGSIMGFVFSKFINISYLGNLSVSNFTLVGMAGLMAGILQAPLTAIFLIAEITGGYELFIPLMIASSIAYITVKYFVPHSVYTLQLARRGELITHHKDQAVLTLMSLEKEIETNFERVTPYDTLGTLVDKVAKSSRNLFPVCDREGHFLGVVLLNDIRELMFERDKYDRIKVHELMTAAPEFVSKTDSMETVMSKFESSNAWNLPVIEDGKYVGFVSKSKLFSAYRENLRQFYDEPD